MNDRGTFLFKVPGALDGLAEVFNLPGFNHVRYSTSSSPAEADSRAIRQDWAAFGDAMYAALPKVRRLARG